jgi:hypothetical protein
MAEARTVRTVRTSIALAVVPAVVLAGGLAACGDSSPSGPSASKADFCGTFDELGSDTTPARAADELSKVGTPDDIDSSARHGFEVLVDHLRDLPDGTQPRKITQMVQGLDAHDAADVRDFITYYASECQGLPADISS